MKALRSDLSTPQHFLTMISLSLSYCREKVFTHINI